MATTRQVPVAMVGIGCRFPGKAESAAGLWNLLLEGRDTVSRVPGDRWDARRLKAFQHPDDAERYDRGCFIDGDIWAWEPEALSVAMLEAATVDPQHRLLLETAWEAVEHAGVPVARLRGSRTGVYLGMYAADNLLRDARPVEDYPDVVYAFGNFPANAAGRVAFAMDLRGPVMVVETMCSSGLVSVHVACNALAAGDCDAALAGAALLMPSPEWLHYEAEWLLSRKGRCYAFDERADGYVRGEGAGVVLLKRLEDAVRDGDRVLAVIRGSAVNADGQSERMTAPSTLVQQDVFRAAVARAGIDPGTVGLVEAHGPGTYVGDPIEYTSIDAVYGQGRGRCALGSVKTHIGHSEPTSGLAGLIKAVQCLRHGQIPPNQNFAAWHPSIPTGSGSRLFVPTELVDAWPVPDAARSAAVCSYGISGTNAHVVVEAAPKSAWRSVSGPGDTAHGRARESDKAQPRVFVLSVASPQALPVAATRLADWLDGPGGQVPLGDVAHTLALRRSPAGERLGVVASSRAELVGRLRSWAGESGTDGAVAGHTVLSGDDPGPVMLFTGQGSQWAGMGRRLMAREPVFAETIRRIEPVMAREGGFSLTALLRRGEELTGVDRVQPVLFAVQVALAEVWKSWGVRPAAVIGQSLGEVAAAVVAGALSLSDGVAVITRRAALLAGTAGGAMASVLLGVERVEADLTAARADGVSIGVVTSPQATVVSGDASQVDRLIGLWTERGETVRPVEVDVASHSAHMDPILQRLHDVLAGVEPREPEIAFYSTVTGDPRGSGPLNARYWVDNQRRTVRFDRACAAALADGHRVFIECAPHPLAVRAVGDIARHASVRDVHVVGSLRRGTDDVETFLTNVASVHCCGQAVDWSSRYGEGELAELPGMSWHRVHYRKDPPYRLVAPGLVGADQHSLLGGHVADPADPGLHLWQTPISPARVPWLIDHQVAGVPVMPGAGVCEMALGAAAAIFGTVDLCVRDLVLDTPLILDPEPLVTVRAVEDGEQAQVEVVSHTDDGSITHARARVAPGGGRRPGGEGVSAALAEGWADAPPSQLYARFRERHDITHGPAFTGLERIQVSTSSDEGIATLRIPNEGRVSSWMMLLHPSLLDEFVQTAVAVWVGRYATAPGPVVVAGFDEVRVYGATGHARAARVMLHEADDMRCRASGVLTLADGTVVAEVEGLRLANITPPEERFASRLSHLQWEPTEPFEPSKSPAGSWLVVGENDGPQAVRISEVLKDAEAECELVTVPLGQSLTPEHIHTADPAGVVLVADPGNSRRTDPRTAADRAMRTIEAVRLLDGLPQACRLWVAWPGEDADPTVDALRGVLRTAAYECPKVAAGLVEFSDSTQSAALARTLLHNGPPIECAWRGAGFSTLRLVPGAPGTSTPGPPALVRRDGSYLISGGLGGLGLLTAAWLAGKGAGRIVLLGRSRPSAVARAKIEELRGAGTEIEAVQGDIGAAGVADEAVREAVATRLPLRGVFHCAGSLGDATIARITRPMLDAAWRGKAEGAWALHRATTGQELDHWVLFSSVASLLGSPGQAVHAAANAWLDGLAAWRRARGLPATSIQWGAWSQVGAGQHMAERGVAMISPTEGVDALERILAAGHHLVAYSPIDLARWTAPYPDAARSALFARQLGKGRSQDGGPGLPHALRQAASDTERQVLLEDHVTDCVRDILGGTSLRITPRTSLVALGLDSLNAVRLRVMLENSLGMSIDGGILWMKPTAAGLAEWILHRLGYRNGQPS
ncbi:phthiocerol synthesis polyketide synthase type I PpsD [Streptomyces fumigatiscleroticus]|nr:phthiocerol synthesis polyketide synthase type I PpsD [Streptomyces fumigatiscleroticus]